MASVRAFSSQSTKWKYSAYWRLWVAIRRPQKEKKILQPRTCHSGLILVWIGYYSLSHTEKSPGLRLQGQAWSSTQSRALRTVQSYVLPGCWGRASATFSFPPIPPYLPFDSRLHSPALEPQVALLCRCWRYLQIRTCSWTPGNGEWWVTTWAWGMAALAMAGRVAGRPGLCAVSGVYRPEPSCGAVHPQSCWPSREQHVIGRNPLFPSLILQGIFKPYLK